MPREAESEDASADSPARSENRGWNPRILVVANLYPSSAHPSFGTFIAARVAALRRAGAVVDVVAIRDAGVHRGIARKYLKLTGETLLVALSRAIRRRRYDVVEAHIAFPTGWVAWPAARLHRAPLVLFVHGSDVAAVSRRSRIHRVASRLLFGRARQIVVNSRYMAGITTEFLGKTTSRIVIGSPGIDYDLFRGVDGTPTAGSGRQGLLFVGRLTEGKGVWPLVEAVELVRNAGHEVTLSMIGTGPELARLETVGSSDPGSHLRIRGPLPPNLVAEAMRQAQVLVVPSIYPEALGLVAIEGLAAGAVVVASRVGGLAETVIEGETGFQARPGDVPDLASAIARALTASASSASRDALVAAGRRLAEEHDVNRIARDALEGYRSLVASPRNAAASRSMD